MQNSSLIKTKGCPTSGGALQLAAFKYYGFFVDSFNEAFGNSVFRLPVPEIVLPVGISFFTFQALSYTIDVQRGDIPACRNWRDVALYISFFPQLVAGPIVRAADFIPQLDQRPRPTFQRLHEGGTQFILGFFKKAFIADNLAQFVDHAFQNHEHLSGGTLLLAVVAYTVQIYCDFSGYSDMAIGSARILGYDFVPNFAHPYLSKSIQEFWRRWHISLSSWLRDYLYIPLGGNRKGIVRTYINLMLTMVLGGLWHGAAWTFVAWGFWHGFWLALNRSCAMHRPPAAKLHSGGGIAIAFCKWLGTMLIVMIGWLLFRSQSFGQAWGVFDRIVEMSDGIVWMPPLVWLCILLVAARHAMLLLPGGREWMELPPGRVRTAFTLVVMATVAVLFAPKEFQPFIYFQF